MTEEDFLEFYLEELFSTIVVANISARHFLAVRMSKKGIDWGFLEELLAGKEEESRPLDSVLCSFSCLAKNSLNGVRWM